MAKTLLVVANKYAALDIDGEPCAVLERPDVPGGKRLIGAAVDAARTVYAASDDPRAVSAGEHVLKYAFTDAPEQLPFDPIHPHRWPWLGWLKTGELLPADEATARAAGVPFVPVAQALERAKSLALHRHSAATGETELGAPPAPEAAPEAPAPPTPAAPAVPVSKRALSAAEGS